MNSGAYRLEEHGAIPETSLYEKHLPNRSVVKKPQEVDGR